MTALIHCQVATGLTIRDTVQLERENIKDGWLRIKRQKTNKPVRQKLDSGLHEELIAVTNGNSRYVFWNGASLPTSATVLWQEDLSFCIADAGEGLPFPCTPSPKTQICTDPTRRHCCANPIS
jgi:hypothetical protein